MGARRSSLHSKATSSGARLEDYSDRQLACLACQGTREAWQALYLRYKDFLWQFARSQLKLPQELGASRQRGVRGNAITAGQFMNEVYIIGSSTVRYCWRNHIWAVASA